MRKHSYFALATAFMLSLCLVFFAARASAIEETSGAAPSPLSFPDPSPLRVTPGEEEKNSPVPAAEETLPATAETSGAPAVEATPAPPAPAPEPEAPRTGPDENIRVKYEGSFGTGTGDMKFTVIRAMYVDKKTGELYVADLHKDTVYIMTTEGGLLFSFNLFRKPGGGGITALALGKDGRIYVSGVFEVAVYSYKGDYIENLNLSGIVDKKIPNERIASLFIDDAGYLYIGMSGSKARIMKLDKDGKLVSQIESDGRFAGVYSLHVTGEGFIFLDAAKWTVWKLDKDGNKIFSFGYLSSLFGGFSRPLGIDIDKKGRIYVIDFNRWMLIIFSPKGKPVFEFGGPGTMETPTGVAVAQNGRIFVSGGSDEIMMFTLIDEPPAPASR